jgi:putative ABC transport system permease protein
MLLTVPERRRFIADLRIMGYRRRRIVQVLGFQAVVLGLLASATGVLAGYALTRIASQDPPGYLAFAFPLGVQRTVAWQVIALSLVGGVLATCLAAMQPLFDLRNGRPVNAALSERGEPGHAIGVRTARWLAIGGVAFALLTTLALLLMPSLTMVGVAAIGIATVLTIPTAFTVVLRVVDVPANRWRLNALVLSVRALRATSLRSLALAATGAVAVFGSVAVEGAHRNLLSGLYRDYREYAGTADIWISQPGDDLALQTFDGRGIAARVRAVPHVRAVRAYRGGLLDLDERRVWIIARSPADDSMIPPSQIVSGRIATANTRLRGRGWITVSRQIADAQHVEPGQLMRLPTPTGVHAYRIAATTTNLGWGPGAIIMNGDDYRRAWASDSPSALEVDLDPGANASAAEAGIRRVLGPGSGLQVQTTAQRSAHADEIAREGLARLSQISTLLLVAAALAMAAAMAAGIWQRRVALAQLRIMGWRPQKLWRALLLETGIVLAVGCIGGALAGIYGHFLGDRWLTLTTGYPAPFSLTGGQAVVVCALVASAALAVTAIPGFLVARTPARFGLNSTA